MKANNLFIMSCYTVATFLFLAVTQFQQGFCLEHQYASNVRLEKRTLSNTRVVGSHVVKTFGGGNGARSGSPTRSGSPKLTRSPRLAKSPSQNGHSGHGPHEGGMNIAGSNMFSAKLTPGANGENHT